MSNTNYMVIKIYCPDRFNFKLLDSNHDLLCEGEHTYIPDWLTNSGSDSDFEMTIDLFTGNIMNWNRPSNRDISKTVSEYNSQD